MENFNIEALNDLISIFQVLGVFAIILCGIIIVYFGIKILQWSCDYDVNKEQERKNIARDVYEEYRRLHWDEKK